MRLGLLFVLLGTGCLEAEATPTDAQLVEALGPPGSTAVVAIPRQATWSYDVTRSERWTEGQAPLGFGETYIATTIPSAATAYFRREFEIGDPSRVRKLYLRVMYDDGVVVSLNGKEALRASMPRGPVVHDTLALGHEAALDYVTFDVSDRIGDLRRTGVNVITAQVHQQSRSSSDLVFDAELIAWTAAPFEPYWLYGDHGDVLGALR